MSEIIDLNTEALSPSGAVVAPPAAAAPAPTGNPSVIGVPLFVVGSIALGLGLTGFVDAGGAPVPILLTATGLGLAVAAVWAAALAQNAVAAVFAVFSGFWLSYGLLVLGLTHGWFGVAAEDVTRTVETFQISWLVLIALLTVGSLRLPLAYPVLFGLISLALALLLAASVTESTTLTKAAGYVVLSFAALGAYLFLDAMAAATGGRPLPLGRPVLR